MAASPLSNYKPEISIQNLILVYVTQLLLCILYYCPEDDPLRSKHVDKLKIQHLLVVRTVIYFSCYEFHFIL